MSISDKALEYIKKHRQQFVSEFASKENYTPAEKPFTIFLAGSPGAGKTEFSKSFDPDLFKFSREQNTKIVRIDADKIRDQIPYFNGTNSSEIQRAASKGVDILFDHVQKNHQNAIVDGTFANYLISQNNVKRALNRNRSVGIFYIYQDPVVAWEFTKKREKIEHRNISKSVFIEAFFAARNNVNKVKQEFNDKIEVDLIVKNFENKIAKYHINIDKIDHYIEIKYTTEQLRKLLEE